MKWTSSKSTAKQSGLSWQGPCVLAVPRSQSHIVLLDDSAPADQQPSIKLYRIGGLVKTRSSNTRRSPGSVILGPEKVIARSCRLTLKASVQ